ncbi:MAG TPA: hypothetical protein PLF61_07700, partial [Candidatus Goldiibacteriota bacterium]|nr:hypothetical protein [Candidatus Goldiibacteriota bacterium]
MFDFLKKLFGARNEREIKKYYEVVKLINNLEPKMEKLTDGELRAKTDEFRERLK